MSTSNPLADAAAEGPIAQGREGMHVVDSAGDDVGTVALVRMGDPEAATTEGQDDDSEGFFGDDNLFGFGGEPDLPPSLQARLIRSGFIKVHSEGLFSADCYVRADRIAGVSGDTVRLNVPRDRIAEEA